MKKNVYLMYAIAFLQGMVFYGPVATLYRQAQGVSVFQITLIEGVSLALCVLLEIPWGMVADKIGYRKTMVFCCGLYFLSKLVFWRAEGFAGFLVERVMLGIVLAGISGVDAGLLYLSCEGRQSQKVFGLYNSLGMGGLLAAAAVFSLWIRDDYRLAGLLTAVSYGAAAVLAIFLEEAKGPERRAGRVKEALAEWRGDGRFLLFLTGAALLTEAHQTVTVFLNQLQYSRCGLGDAAIGGLYILAAALGLGGGLSAALTRKTGVRGAFVLFCGVGALSCFTLALTRSAVPSVMGILALRMSNTLFQPFSTELQNRHVRTAHRATALSVNAMFMDCVAIGTNLAFGALSEVALSAAFWFGGGICGAGLLLFFLWYRGARGREG